MGELIYLPAINGSNLDWGKYVDEMVDKLGFNHNFLYEDKSVHYYPRFLISYYYGRQYDNIKKKFGFKNIFIKGDSGGFQNITMDANLDPVDVMKWQQENCDSGLILDHPPFKKIEGSAQFGATTDAIYNDALAKTVKNANIAMKHWTDDKFKLYGVVQGDTVKRQEKWLQAMLDVEKQNSREFSGWSLSPKPSHDIKQIANHAANFIEAGITNKPIHILQISGFESLAMSAYVSKFFTAEVTVDSSTFNVGRIYFTYFSPFNFKDKWDFGGRDPVSLKKVACDCPVCVKVEQKHFTYDEWEHRTPPGSLISLHNLYQILKYVKFLNALKDDDKLFKKFCLKNFGQKFINVCDYLDEVSKFGKQDSYRNNVVKSHKLSSWMDAEEINVNQIREERIELLKKEFPGIAETGIDALYKHRWG